MKILISHELLIWYIWKCVFHCTAVVVVCWWWWLRRWWWWLGWWLWLGCCWLCAAGYVIVVHCNNSCVSIVLPPLDHHHWLCSQLGLAVILWWQIICSHYAFNCMNMTMTQIRWRGYMYSVADAYLREESILGRRSDEARANIHTTAVRLHVYLVFVKSIEQELKIQWEYRSHRNFDFKQPYLGNEKW